MREFCEVTWPAIVKQALREHAWILSLDEMGLRADQLSRQARGFSPRGKTPIRKTTGQRFGMNLMIALGVMGEMFFQAIDGRVNSRVFIEFLERLLLELDGKIYLILDRAGFHTSKEVRDWLYDPEHACRRRLRLVYLPPYSPKLNATEFINNDIKGNTFTNSPPANKAEMRRKVCNRLNKIRQDPDRVSNYYRAKPLGYITKSMPDLYPPR